MTLWYIDTSAALKLLIAETESDVLARALDEQQPELAAGYLLETEVRRAVQRVNSLTQEAAAVVLDSVDLYEMPPSLFREAGLLTGPSMRSLDAIHLTAAVRIGVDALLTYDHRVRDAATQLGLNVIATGSG